MEKPHQVELVFLYLVHLGGFQVFFISFSTSSFKVLSVRHGFTVFQICLLSVTCLTSI